MVVLEKAKWKPSHLIHPPPPPPPVQTQMEEVGRHSNVSLLRSTMTGEDILQVWLKQHPEVSRSPQEHQAKVSGEHQPKVSVLDAPRSKGSRDQLSVLPNSVPRDEDDMEIPQELAPYENLLPPSLLPPTLQYGMYLATPTRWGEV